MTLSLAKLKELAEAATPIYKYPQYSITRNGIVFSVESNWRGYGIRPITQIMNRRGYLKVRLSVNGRRINRAVHKLVCETFHGTKPTQNHEVRHIDGNPLNNNADNLCWGTRSENAQDRKKHGTERAAENGRKSAYKRTRKYKALRESLERLP